MAGIEKMDGIWELRSIYRWDNESIFLGIIVIYIYIYIYHYLSDIYLPVYLILSICLSVCLSVRLFVRPSVLYSMREIIFSREMFHCCFFHPMTKDFTHLHTLQTICLWAQNSWTSKNWMISDPKVLPLCESSKLPHFSILFTSINPSRWSADPPIFFMVNGHLHGYILW